MMPVYHICVAPNFLISPSALSVKSAFTYALTGGLVGCAAGLLIYKLLYDILIISHFSYAALSLPAASLLIILFFVCTAAIAAVYAPAKRMRNMEITEIINEL